MFKSFKFNELDRLARYFDSSTHINYKHIGKGIFENDKNLIKKSIEQFYIGSNKTMLDGNKIMKEWFPEVKSHVFISHSHADIDKIYELAGFLNHHFGIKAFIDSSIWGYADELLRMIDDDYCYKTDSQTYTYEKRNVTTSNVYLMLLNSLQSMIDNTECILFVETPNSVKKIPEQISEKTYSPWIFSELNMIDVIRTKIPKRLSKQQFEKRASESIQLSESLQIVYEISDQLKRIDDLYFNDIIQWNRNFKSQSNNSAETSLDKLYEIKGVIK